MLALACVPIRIGVHIGGSSSKLLVPLYVVVLAAVLLLAWELYAGDARVRELGLVAWPLAAYVAWTGVSLVWSKDVSAGAIELLAFYVPFTLLALAIARLPWSRARPAGAVRRGDADGGSRSRSSASTSTRPATSSRTRR